MADSEEDVRVNLVVSKGQKERWDSAKENSPEYSSLSDLIRQSVAHELSQPPGAASRTAKGRETTQPAETEAQTEAIEQITKTLSRMETTLSDLDSRLTNVEQEVTATARAELKNEVFDALPEYESEDSPDGKSADQIAEEVNSERDRVSEVLTRLEEQTGAIRVTASEEGRQFYAREGGQ